MMRRPGKKDAPIEGMSRRETAVWLGRALSTNEVTLRVVLDLLDVVAFQQAAIKQLTEQNRLRSAGEDGKVEKVERGERGEKVMEGQPDLETEIAQKVVEKLTRWREELTPVLHAVEDACQQCEKMISST
ncbi:MAG TPA: hypothetical protein VFN35_32580 [Ktedonobacteraceae bacterium]|nr:hypothetical protein [Ktedonobacteraceae bacterium]